MISLLVYSKNLFKDRLKCINAYIKEIALVVVYIACLFLTEKDQEFEKRQVLSKVIIFSLLVIFSCEIYIMI